MQQTPHRCPHCSQLLALSSDMWGLYYLCDACGWTCEDDDGVPGLKGLARKVSSELLGNHGQPPARPRPSQ